METAHTRPWGALFLAVSAACLALLVVLLPARRPVVWTLSDGSTLQVVKVTWGTNHFCRCSNRLPDWLYPFLPATLRSNFNFQVATVSTPPPDRPVVWMRRTGAPINVSRMSLQAALRGTTDPKSLQRQTAPCWVSVVDDVGVESELSVAVVKGGIGTNAQLVAAEIPWFPRSARSFRVRIWSCRSVPKATLEGEFRVPNRARTRLSRWQPETLPATRRTNGLEVTLVNLQTGLSAPVQGEAVFGADQDAFSSGAGLRATSLATFHVREGGLPSANWVAACLVISNTSGDVVEQGPTTFWPREAYVGISAVAIYSGLWPEEPAWKMAVELSRVGGFAPDDLWTIRRLPVRGSMVPAGWGAAKDIHGEQAKFVDIKGAGGLAFPVMEAGDEFGARVSLVLRAPPSVNLTTLDLKDNWGRTGRVDRVEVKPVGQGGVNPLQARQWTFGLSLPSDAITFEITFGLGPAVNVEFSVKPMLTGSSQKQNEIGK
jgi:hypothetical protein